METGRSKAIAASAERVLVQYGASAVAFAQTRYQSAVDQRELDEAATWRGIIAELHRLLARRRC